MDASLMHLFQCFPRIFYRHACYFWTDAVSGGKL